jgi:ankyrin repeat protein
MAQACLSVLLRLDDGAEENGGVGNSSSLARYAAEHWVTHAQFRNVSLRLQNAMESLFDLDKPYFTVWLRLSDIDMDLYTSPLYYFSDGQKLDAGPLYYAALCGFKGLVEKLIIKYPHLVNATGGYYQTPALAALARRHVELARMLHRNGSSVDLRHWFERSPLHSAACMGDSEIIQVLLDCKLDINAKSYNDETSLYLALRDRPPNYFETIQLLLEHGADPNARTSDGFTPLHLPSDMGTVEDLRLLLKYGADVEAVDKMGKTAFQVASEKGRDEIANFLSVYGAKDIS